MVVRGAMTGKDTTMILRAPLLSMLGVAVCASLINSPFARPLGVGTGVGSFHSKAGFERTAVEIEVSKNEYQTDVDRLIALRSRPFEELISLASQLEAKWQRLDWNSYARIMAHVCSEISDRGLNDERVRAQREHFARVALSHSSMYLWEHESFLVGSLGYRQYSSDVNTWLRERREKAELWLHALRRLEKQTDPSFDINDRKSLPAMRVSPPYETGLPAGTPPSAIKDERLRAKYEAAIADNKRKALRVDEQLPLLAHGPAFKQRAEHWLIQAYSQPPNRTAELKHLLNSYVRDNNIRQRILSEVGKNSK